MKKPQVDMADIVNGVSKLLADQGKLVEAGFVGLMQYAFPHGCPPIQREEMRNAFFAGAHHVFTSMINIMDEDEEPTAQDLNRLELMHDELQAFIRDFQARRMPTDGSA